MSALLQAELLKLRTTRTFVALVGVASALSLLVVLLITLIPDDFSEADAVGLFAVDFTPLFILLLGAIGMTGEWRHRTITGTVLAAPDRIRLLAAKALSYAIAGAVLSLIVSLVAGLVGTIILSTRGEVTADLTEILDILWRNVVVAAFLGAFGVCLGAIIRNQIVAVIGILIFSQIVETTLIAFAPDVGRFGPMSAAPAGVQNLDFGEDSGGDELELLDPAAALLVLIGWASVAFGLAAMTLRGRDLV